MIKPEVGQVWRRWQGTGHNVDRRIVAIEDETVLYEIRHDSGPWEKCECMLSTFLKVIESATLVTPALPEVGERWERNGETYRVKSVGNWIVLIDEDTEGSCHLVSTTWQKWSANATRIGDERMSKQLNVYDITTNKRDAGLTDLFSVVAENFAHAATLADIHKKVGHSIERIDAHRVCRGAIPSPVTSVQVNETATA